MASLDFPSNPTNGQTYALNGVTYYYNSSIGAWLTQLTSMNLSTSSNTQVLFNDAGLANGSPGFVFNKVANTATVNALNTLGNLGLGTTSPNYKLQIIPSNVGSPGIYIGDGNSSNFYDGVLVQGTADGSVGGFTAFSRVDVANTTVAYVNLNYTSNYGTAFITTGNSLSFQTGQTLRANGFDPTKTRLTIATDGTVSTTGGLIVGNTAYQALTNSISLNNGRIMTTKNDDWGMEMAGANGIRIRFYSSSGGQGTTVGSVQVDGTSAYYYTGNLYVYRQGIKFPATQEASTDANILDDYEEGTFTCSRTYVGGNYTYTPGASDKAYYTKIGQNVTVWVYQHGTESGSVSPTYRLWSLPFSAVTDTHSIPSVYNNATGTFTAGRTNGSTFLSFLATPPSGQDLYLTVTYRV